MSNEIRKAGCLRLNKYLCNSVNSTGTGIGVPPVDVFVEFSADNTPIRIMCDKYDESRGRCSLVFAKQDVSDACIYSEWKQLKR